MSKYCPFCGEEVDPDSIYCLNCGKKLPDRAAPAKGAPSWDTPPEQPPYQRGPQASYSSIYVPRPYHPSMKAPFGERCIAYLLDSVVSSILTYCLCIGCVYVIIKDSIRDGQSVGKGFMNLRVVDYQTGMPATVGQSCIRNCLCGWLDGLCCYLAMFFDTDGRRLGDQIAGTVVILDK